MCALDVIRTICLHLGSDDPRDDKVSDNGNSDPDFEEKPSRRRSRRSGSDKMADVEDGSDVQLVEPNERQKQERKEALRKENLLVLAKRKALVRTGYVR